MATANKHNWVELQKSIKRNAQIVESKKEITRAIAMSQDDISAYEGTNPYDWLF